MIKLFLIGILLFNTLSMHAAVPTNPHGEQPGVTWDHYHQPHQEPKNPFTQLPHHKITTGSDQATTTHDKTNSMDTTPVDTTGTENDIHLKLPLPE